MSILISLLLLQASATEPGTSQPAPAPADATATAARVKESKICRDMLTSSSRVRPLRVCKTRAAWKRWERCHSATRYCAPPKQPTVTVVSLPGDKLICKYIKTTGSRIEQEKVCGTKAQWEIADRETQQHVRNVQNQSMNADDAGVLMPVSPGRAPGPR